MTGKTRVRMIPTIVVVTAVLAAAWIIFPTAVDTLVGGRDRVLIEFMFKPEHRTGAPPQGRMFTDAVTTEIVLGATGTKQTLTEPWSTEVPAVKGQRIKVTASQVYGAEISIRISQTGFPPAFKSGIGPVELLLSYVVK